MTEISFLPFCKRHGKSDCDRHFFWIRNFLGTPGSECTSVAHVIQAIENGSRKFYGASSRTFVTECNLIEPGENAMCRYLDFVGIQSCHGFTYHQDINDVVNHVFPDVDDRKVGLRGFMIKSKPYTRYDNGNVLSEQYKKFERPTVKKYRCVAQFKTRMKWLELIAQQEEYGFLYQDPNIHKNDPIIGVVIYKTGFVTVFDCEVEGITLGCIGYVRVRKQDRRTNKISYYDYKGQVIVRRINRAPVLEGKARGTMQWTRKPNDLVGMKFAWEGEITYKGFVHKKLRNGQYLVQFEHGIKRAFSTKHINMMRKIENWAVI